MGSRYSMLFGKFVAVAGVAGVMALSASAASASTGGVTSVEKLVPAAVKSAGTLTVAADATYAPDEFMQGQTVVGMDADLMNAIGKAMGLKVTIKNVTFDDIIPSMVAGRYMVGASSFTDTKAREKQVTFVDYANVGMSFYTLEHGGAKVTNMLSICGLTVSVEAGTTELDAANAEKAECVKAHKKADSVDSFSTQNEANLAVEDHHAQIGFADTPVAGYQVTQSKGLFKLVGDAIGKAPYGLALEKSTHLGPAVKAALLYLMKNGTYQKILKKWGDQSIEVGPSFVKITGA